jgi:hypothetical protein
MQLNSLMSASNIFQCQSQHVACSRGSCSAVQQWVASVSRACHKNFDYVTAWLLARLLARLPQDCEAVLVQYQQANN